MIINVKKYILLLMCAFLSISLFGCNFKINKDMFSKNKPSKFHYTSLLMSDLSIEKPTEIYALYMNFYKEKDFDHEDLSTFADFFNSLNNDSFIDKPTDLPKKPLYKIFISFNENKYIINIYNENYISIYPFDGDYKMDYIDTSKMYKAYNLYGLCKYLIPN